jgi:hypothetical protein
MDFSHTMTQQQDFNFNQKYYPSQNEYNYFYNNTSTPTTSQHTYQTSSGYNYFYPQIDTYSSQSYFSSCTTPPPQSITNPYQSIVSYGTYNQQQQHQQITTSPQLNKQEVC